MSLILFRGIHLITALKPDINQLKISIVTVVFNAESVLEATLESIFSQDFTDREVLLTDGGSTDGSLRIARRFRQAGLQITSAPDRGIYDAMNKSIARANGDFVLFMNAGDRFFDAQTLGKFMRNTEDASVIYGDYQIAYPTFVKHKKVPPRPEALLGGMVMNHQSVFVRRELLLQNLFDFEKYGNAADFAQLIRFLHQKVSFRYVPETCAVFADGGISSQKKDAYLADCQKIVAEYFPEKYRAEYFIRQRKLQKRADLIRKLAGKKLFFFLMRLKNRR